MIRDVQFGPVVSFGLGGIYVEILREISQAHVPMTEEQLETLRTDYWNGATKVEPRAYAQKRAEIKNIIKENIFKRL